MKVTATFFLLLAHLFIFYSLSFAQCSFSLGNDTTFCLSGSALSFTINGPAAYDLYLWNTSETTSSISINENGIYSCTASLLLGGDLVFNGNFSIGDTGFTTGYLDHTGGDVFATNTYAITTDPNTVHIGFMSFGDHTTGSGNMMVCNGAEVADHIVWEQTITVVPGTDYNFSAWATSVQNLSSYDAPARLQFSVNGVLIGSVYNLPLTGGDWTNFYADWNSGSASSAVIAIIDQNITGLNDFALDDIVFQKLCLFTDSITVNGIHPPDIHTAPTGLIPCSASTIALNSSSSTAGVSYNWAGTGIISGSTTPVPVINAAGTYVLTITEPVAGCKSTDSVTVIKFDSPHADYSSLPGETSNALIPVSFTDQSTIPSGIITSWYWNFGDASRDDTSVLQNPIHTFTADGIYHVLLAVESNNGCRDTIRYDYTVGSDIELPNVFTPNNDGKNDLLAFKNLEFFPGTSIEIYNRWGEKIYSNPDYHNDWNGEGFSDGIYYFTLTGPKLKEIKYGFVQMIH